MQAGTQAGTQIPSDALYNCSHGKWEPGQPWARRWMEMADGQEGPDGFYPSLTHFAGCLTDGQEV